MGISTHIILQVDQTRLSRILDVAQDLKTLSQLLNSSPFLFVIDLAVLASRREYLKLDKWLTDKLLHHKENFTRVMKLLNRFLRLYYNSLGLRSDDPFYLYAELNHNFILGNNETLYCRP